MDDTADYFQCTASVQQEVKVEDWASGPGQLNDSAQQHILNKFANQRSFVPNQCALTDGHLGGVTKTDQNVCECTKVII